MALGQLLDDDDDRILLGQDVAVPGGPYGLTRNLLKQFGGMRVRDTPISEAAIMGAATGAALAGLKPIVEIMFLDFISLGLDQLVNNAAKLRFYLPGDPPSIPLIVHTLYGGRASMGAQHSQALEAWLTHTPGITVAFPSTSADIYGVLRAAAALDEPTVVISAISLLTQSDAVDPAHCAVTDYRPGTSRLLQSGAQATVVTYGVTAHLCARALQGCDVDVIDLRWLSPWDVDAVLSSVRRTSRLVIVHDAVTQGGFGAEIAATVADRAIWSLDAPIVRVGAEFSPVASRPAEWQQTLPTLERIRAAVEKVVTC